MAEEKKPEAKPSSVDAFGRKKTIDDYKGTEAYKKYRQLCENGAKERKSRGFFTGSTK